MENNRKDNDNSTETNRKDKDNNRMSIDILTKPFLFYTLNMFDKKQYMLLCVQ